MSEAEMTDEEMACIAEIVPHVLESMGEDALCCPPVDERTVAVRMAREVVSVARKLNVDLHDEEGAEWRQTLWPVLIEGILLDRIFI